MPDREKVKKGLECCLTLDSPCGDCPYYSYEDIQELDCERNLRHDAIALLKQMNGLMLALEQSNAVNEYLNAEVERLNGLLKEQDAVEPTIDEHGNKRCGSCGYKLQSIADPDLFCCKCGKQVKWE